MQISSDLLEIVEHTGEGYKPLVDYSDWRVAILNLEDEYVLEKINKFSRHNQTDEVFLLLKGKCILFIGEGDVAVTDIHAVDMQPLKLYNVKKSAWHTHTLSDDAMVLIVENRDTSPANSPDYFIDEKQKRKLVELTQSLWG